MPDELPRSCGRLPTAPPTAPGTKGAAWIVVVGLGLVPCLVTGLSAQPPTPSYNEDVRQELFARQKLFGDKLLGPLNLGVRVHRRVAVLWGPVPSAELARRAVALLEQLPDFVEVRDQLTVEPAAERPPRERYLPAPDLSHTAPLKRGMLTKHSALALAGLPSPVGYPQGTPAGSAKPSPAAPADPEAAPVLPAIAIPGQACAALSESAGGPALIEVVTRLQRADPRFGRLQVEVRGNVVHLRGEVQRWTDVHELARAVASLPGVDRVVLGEVHALVAR